MANFNLRVCGGFIDVEAPALCDSPKKRSASAPPRKGGNGVRSESEHLGSSNNNPSWAICYLALLPERAATLPKLSPKDKDSMEVRPLWEESSYAAETTRAPTPEEDSNATECLKSEVADSQEIQGYPQQMLSNPWPCMPEAQYCPRHAERFPHEENIAMQKCLTEVVAIEPITTMMLCDIPCRLSIQEVVDAMDLQGFSNTFDLIYMPRPKGLRSEKAGLHHNLGYAFVNFTTPEKATEFVESFSDFIFPGGYSMKRCYTKPALCQGYKANWKKHSVKAFCGDNWKPLCPMGGQTSKEPGRNSIAMDEVIQS